MSTAGARAEPVGRHHGLHLLEMYHQVSRGSGLRPMGIPTNASHLPMIRHPRTGSHLLSMRDPVLASACAGCDDGPASTCSRMLTDMFGRRMMALLLPTGLTLSVCRLRDPSHENAGNMPSSNVVMHIDLHEGDDDGGGIFPCVLGQHSPPNSLSNRRVGRVV